MSQVASSGIDIDEHLLNTPDEILEYVASHPSLRVSDFTGPPDPNPKYKGLAPGLRELVAELQVKRPLSYDVPKRYHPEFYAEVSRIRARRGGLPP